tara:strand:+ start:1671 stop:2468 length:798 start_codon:yes stop_codon:yes gene_type:complete
MIINKRFNGFTDEHFQTVRDEADFGLTSIWEIYDEPLMWEWEGHRAALFIPKRICAPEKEVRTIGVWMSGGADSSLTTWLLCKYIKDHNLPIKVLPTSVRRGRPNNPIYAGNVIDFIQEDLQFELEPHIVYYPPKNDPHQLEIQEFEDRNVEHFEKDMIQINYSGITSNPPVDDITIERNKERTRDLEKIKPIMYEAPNRAFIECFSNVNKKFMAMLYAEYNLTDRLYPITYSCEGTVEDNKWYTRHCGKCWWCKERVWAFGRII